STTSYYLISTLHSTPHHLPSLFFLPLRPPPRSPLFPTRRSSDLASSVGQQLRTTRRKRAEAAGGIPNVVPGQRLEFLLPLRHVFDALFVAVDRLTKRDRKSVV